MEDNSQKAAISFDRGSALILAGPGSGKTYVLTHHIEYLIQSGNSPNSILVLTFTKKAAYEMKSRFTKIMPSAADRVVFGTFHSVFYRFLKIFNIDTPKIISEEEKEKILCKLSESEDSYLDYKSIIHERNLIDFDDIISMCLELIQNNVSLKEYIQAQFQFALIDEFQDINEEQYLIIRSIFLKHGNVFAVGDQDQSIYGFRGASYNIMNQFIEDFEDVSVLELAYNYRNPKDIMALADKVISENPGRLRTKSQICFDKSEEIHFSLRVSKNEKESRKQFLHDLFQCIDKGISSVVLLRTNKEVYEFQRMINGIEKDDDIDLIKREIYMDFFYYLDFVINKTRISFSRIINIPERYLPKRICEDFENDLEELTKNNLGTYKGDSLFIFSNQIKTMEKLLPLSFSMYLRKVINHEDYIIGKYPNINSSSIARIYDEIISASSNYRSLSEFKDFFLEIDFEKKKSNGKEKEKCSVMTYHQAKGLEFDSVFLPDVVEGKVPGKIAMEECSVEEERRLFYVAITRAQKHLYIYTIKNEESNSMLPSRFMKNIIY